MREIKCHFEGLNLVFDEPLEIRSGDTLEVKCVVGVPCGEYEVRSAVFIPFEEVKADESERSPAC